LFLTLYSPQQVKNEGIIQIKHTHLWIMSRYPDADCANLLNQRTASLIGEKLLARC